MDWWRRAVSQLALILPVGELCSLKNPTGHASQVMSQNSEGHLLPGPIYNGHAVSTNLQRWQKSPANSNPSWQECCDEPKCSMDFLSKSPAFKHTSSCLSCIWSRMYFTLECIYVDTFLTLSVKNCRICYQCQYPMRKGHDGVIHILASHDVFHVRCSCRPVFDEIFLVNLSRSAASRLLLRCHTNRIPIKEAILTSAFPLLSSILLTWSIQWSIANYKYGVPYGCTPIQINHFKKKVDSMHYCMSKS